MIRQPASSARSEPRNGTRRRTPCSSERRRLDLRAPKGRDGNGRWRSCPSRRSEAPVPSRRTAFAPGIWRWRDRGAETETADQPRRRPLRPSGGSSRARPSPRPPRRRVCRSAFGPPCPPPPRRRMNRTSRLFESRRFSSFYLFRLDLAPGPCGRCRARPARYRTRVGPARSTATWHSCPRAHRPPSMAAEGRLPS